MIRYIIKENLLEAPVQALVNTVNTVGVMGKGIALQFKETFPNNFKSYLEACKSGWLRPGKLLVNRENTIGGEKIIINFPTKTEWFKKSSYEYIESGLLDLVKIIVNQKINSIAIPPLGCGNGGLQWEEVKILLETHLSPLVDVEILIYEPNEEIKRALKIQESKKIAKLTQSRAMLLYSLFYYEALGEASSLFVANKLAYFLQRLGENLRLKFKAHYYGPYSVQVGHVLHSLNGKYLKGLEQMNAKAFEPLELNYELFNEVEDYIKRELNAAQKQRLLNLTNLIDGFQSTLSLEVLATVDYVRDVHNAKEKEEVFEKIQNWNERKRKLFDEKHLDVAIQHLDRYARKFALATEADST